MQARTEELLYVLLWTAETFTQPLCHTLSGSLDTWAGKDGLGRRLAELERKKLIERGRNQALERVVRLTQEGVRVALGGRDPVAQWSRPWDGRWRIVLFDLPIDEGKLRRQLHRTLRRNHLGYLQDSVWVTPDSALAVRASMGGLKVQPDAFLVMEARPAAGESDAEIVLAAWNFTEINGGYERYLRLARGARPARPGLAVWARRENALWREAVAKDPLLPRSLLPKGNLGEEALHTRQKLLRSL